MERTALVIGATGGVGSETALALLTQGWKVRALHRRPEEAAKTTIDPRIEWVRGDAMDAASVIAAAKGVSVIFHGANPPGYRNWKGLVLPMLESTIAAARSVGARIVLPGTVYNYSTEVLPRVSETTEQKPDSRKGKIRVQMEERLRACGVPVLILRAGDFFGAQAKNSWFGQAVVRPGKPLRWILDPSTKKAGHAWAYLPDVARTVSLLLERASELESFAVFHFRGHFFAKGTGMSEAVREVVRAPILPFPWFVISMLAPFVETFREMIEVRWLWKNTLELVNEKLVAFLGEEPHTEIGEAVTETLRGLDVRLPEASLRTEDVSISRTPPHRSRGRSRALP